MQYFSRIRDWLLRAFPNFLWPLKMYILKSSLRHVGKNFRFGADSIFSDPKMISVGDNCFMGVRTVINTVVPVTIGDNVMFGPEVMVMGGDHNFTVVGEPMRFVKKGGINLPVIIENDVWVGARSIILKGVTIGEGAIIGAGSLVIKNVLPCSINVGSPAKPIKCRFNRNELATHLKKTGSEKSIELIVELYKKEGIILD